MREIERKKEIDRKREIDRENKIDRKNERKRQIGQQQNVIITHRRKTNNKERERK